jgi:N-acetyl sugar amidotransferase
MGQVAEAKYGLPTDVIFCKRCVMSNQRPASSQEFKHTTKMTYKTLNINEDGICDACRYAEQKERIDWKKREEELCRLLDLHRRDDGRYDCVVPGSGGKDSAFAAHVLKYKYGMHPLTVTWPPLMYTDYGYRNFRNWIEVGGFDNISFKPNGKVHKLLTRLSIDNLLHPFQTFILGQKYLPPKIAIEHEIPLIFYGENEAEYGNPIADNSSSLRDKSYYAFQHRDDICIAGAPIRQLREKYHLTMNDLSPFLPVGHHQLERSSVEVRYLGYYLKWTPQESYYYAVEHTGFQARPFRSQGTYSKYSGIDDKIDDLHFYTTYIKFGIGRATYDASQEIRNKHLTREEGVQLVHRFDGEFPDRYFKEAMEFLDMTPDHFFELCDKFRSPHLWHKVDGKWQVRHKVI